MDALGAAVIFVLRGALSLALLTFLSFALLWFPISLVISLVRTFRGIPPPSGSRWRRFLVDPAETLGNALEKALVLMGAAWRLVRTGGKRRVRLAGFEDWPGVYRTGGRDDAPQILLEARYASPASMRVAKVWAVIAAIVFGFWLADRLSLSARGADQGGWVAAVLWGAVSGMMSFYGWRAVFRRTLWRFSMTPLRMTFWKGGIEWKGEAQGRKRFGFGGADLVKPGEKWNPELVPHRLAAKELRDNEERRQRRQKPKTMYYQQCSEVVIFAGPGLPRTLPVAELAEDEHGEKARALVAAIIAAHALALGAGHELGLVDTAQPVEEPDALSAPNGRRRGLRR